MALPRSLSSKAFILFFLFQAFNELGAFGITCENLDPNRCAYAVSSSGMRCVLEKQVDKGGREHYTCRSSEIMAGGIKDWIETDECVKACGIDRNSLGISSDSLLESHFMEKLCSHQCYRGCPNIVDLFFNLAAAEGVFLPKSCEAQRMNARRAMAEIRSSGVVFAAGPVSGGSEKIMASSPVATVEAFAPVVL